MSERDCLCSPAWLLVYVGRHQPGCPLTISEDERTEDWCRGLFFRHLEPRPATLAARTWGFVTIVYMEDPVVDCLDPVCDDCYQTWLECHPGLDPTTAETDLRARVRVGRLKPA